MLKHYYWLPRLARWQSDNYNSGGESMNKFQKMVLAAGAMGLIAVAPVANAIPFTVTAASFTPGSGYGIDANESSGTQLDVRFDTSGTFTAQNFNLNSVGQFLTFNFGTVDLEEANEHGGINSNETDNLGVTASFTFTDPLGSITNILATGTAITGSVSDSHVDYTLVWNPITVAFGSGGLFEIAMDSLSFSGTGSQVQTATISLEELPEEVPPTATVPEPATLALLGLGLLGAAAAHRKSAKNNTL